MTRKSLMVLFVALAIGAGIAASVWAYVCCTNWCLCSGSHAGVPDTCLFDFDVHHDRDCGVAHQVYLYIMPEGGQGYTQFLTTLVTPGPPYPVCLDYRCELELQANTVYYYYFRCPVCDEECCYDTFNTGNCGG